MYTLEPFNTDIKFQYYVIRRGIENTKSTFLIPGSKQTDRQTKKKKKLADKKALPAVKTKAQQAQKAGRARRALRELLAF